jgi:hypothetical protein
MPSFESTPIPQVRVFRKAGRLVAAPPRGATALGSHLRVVLTYAVGLWPLTCVVLLGFGLLIVAANAAAR